MMTVKEKIHQIVEEMPESDAEALLFQLNGEDENSSNHGLKAISDLLLEIARNAPQEELDRFPPDFNENLDFYLYGMPKRTPSK